LIGSHDLTRLQWEYEVQYTPGPDVYNMLHRVRRAPPTITPNLPNACPIGIRGSLSKIVDRKQYQTTPKKHYYEVEVRVPLPPDVDLDDGSDGDSDESASEEALLPEELHDIDWDTDSSWRVAVVQVDVSRILRIVSSRELERFENAEFRKEVELGAQVKKWEAEERAAYLMEKNEAAPGAGRGSRMLVGLGSSFIAVNQGRGRARPPKRGRGRGGRNHWLSSRTARGDETTASAGAAGGTFEALDLAGSATEDEEEGEALQHTSPIMLSSFVANSALPLSPLTVRRGHPEVPDIDDSDDESMSSAAQQLAYEKQLHERQVSASEDERPSKKRRTDSITRADVLRAAERLSFARNHASEDSGSGDESSGRPSAAEDEQDEEYVVDSILEHSYQDGVKYYLVKWEGYDDASDWLAEDDLEGAVELLEEYNATIRARRR
jgi:hypothetical protein